MKFLLILSSTFAVLSASAVWGETVNNKPKPTDTSIKQVSVPSKQITTTNAKQTIPATSGAAKKSYTVLPDYIYIGPEGQVIAEGDKIKEIKDLPNKSSSLANSKTYKDALKTIPQTAPTKPPEKKQETQQKKPQPQQVSKYRDVISLTVMMNALSNVTGFAAETEYRTKVFGYSLFYRHLSVDYASSEVKSEGDVFGAGIHYRPWQYWWVSQYHALDFGAFINVGAAKFQGNEEEEVSPLYIVSYFGLDVSYRIWKNIDAYSRFDTSYIYHDKEGALYLGSDVSFGLKFNF